MLTKTRFVVPDASVILKWVLGEANERYHDKAMAIRNAAFAGLIELHVPTLWAYEVGNQACLQFPIDAYPIILDVLGMHMTEHAAPLVSEIACALAINHKVSFYDAVYHAIAINNQGVLVTDDERYFQRAFKAGHIVRLADWA